METSSHQSWFVLLLLSVIVLFVLINTSFIVQAELNKDKEEIPYQVNSTSVSQHPICIKQDEIKKISVPDTFYIG